MKAVGDLKTCSTCREVKALGEFHKNRHRPDGLHSNCKQCVSEANRRWREANPEKKRAQKVREIEAGHQRRYQIERYGISVEDFDRMLAEQLGRCAICSDLLELPHIDHCHTSGRVRGLLCRGCNHGLGNFRDNTDFLAAAIRYLGE